MKGAECRPGIVAKIIFAPVAFLLLSAIAVVSLGDLTWNEAWDECDAEWERYWEL